MTELKRSVSGAVASGITRLKAAGVPNPAQEARWIWEGVTGTSHSKDIAEPDEEPTGPAVFRFNRAVERRVSGEPLAYVLGTAEFRHLTLTTDRRALIPRPETEGLIDLVLARQRSGRVLDVGTGTGCIALSLAQEGAFELVVAVERSPDALALARMNVAQTGLPVHLVLGNFCRMFESGAFDVLVSNPPYLSDLEYTNLEPGVRNWEPEGALRAGRTGMDAVHQVLREGRDVVKARGWIILEIDSVRGELSAEAAGGAGWCEVTVLDDLFGRARYLLARRSE